MKKLFFFLTIMLVIIITCMFRVHSQYHSKLHSISEIKVIKIHLIRKEDNKNLIYAMTMILNYLWKNSIYLNGNQSMWI